MTKGISTIRTHPLTYDATAPTDPASVRMWPVEYNSYSVGGRIILRPDGRKEWVVTNHLGSTVAVVEVSTPTAPVVGQQHTTAYGHPITVKGAVDADRARTGYIGRETDAEHNLGAFGARLYSSEYGRFLAVDKLWEKYRNLQGYQYAGNSPVMAVDRNGKEINFASLLSTASFDDDTKAQEIVDRTAEDLRWLTGLTRNM